MVDFDEMDFMEGTGSKVYDMYHILKSASHCLLVERWNEIGWSKFLLESALECPYVCYGPPLLRKGGASSCKRFVRDAAAERVWYCNINDPGAR